MSTLNDILNGKPTGDEPTPAGGPYRDPQVPDVTATCRDCRRSFTTKANSGATRCARCHLASVHASTPMSYTAANLRPDQGVRVLRVIVGIAVALVLAMVRAGTCHGSVDEPRAVRGYGASEDRGGRSISLAAEAGRLADRMCACEDADCAAAVEAAYARWLAASAAATVDDVSLAAIRDATAEYDACRARIAPGGAPP